MSSKTWPAGPRGPSPRAECRPATGGRSRCRTPPPSWRPPSGAGSSAPLPSPGRRGRGMTRDGCTVVPGPLYHNGPFVWAAWSLLAGRHVVLLGRFDAEATLRRIAEHRADMVYLVPTMMLRIWRLPESERRAHDLSSLETVWHMAAPCPASR